MSHRATPPALNLWLSLLALIPASAFAQAPVTGIVFADRNGNSQREPDEPGVEHVAVSNQVDVSVSDGTGTFTLPGPGLGIVFVSVPDGYQTVGPFWRALGAGALDAPVSFPLQPLAAGREFTFLHASDTHIQPAAIPRFDRLRAIVDSVKPAFVLITGDLVRDALRVGETEARGYYELFVRERARVSAPVWNVPGNHEIFGIERHLSLVPATHPLYGRKMYRSYLGPDYYSFTYGGVHFVGLNTVDVADLYYHGHVDSTQLRWLEQDLTYVPPTMPIVTFNHIPFFSSAEGLGGYTESPPAPTLIRVNGRDQFRHIVSNANDVLAVLRDRPYPLALAGHIHMRERIEYATAQGKRTRFEQAAAVVGPGGPTWMPMSSGVTVYRVRNGTVGEGTFVPLDPPVGAR